MENLTIEKPHLSKVKKKNLEKSFISLNSCNIALILSFSSAILLAGSGLILSSLSYFNILKQPELMNQIGTFLMLFAAPLFFCSAHCLDKINRKEKG